MELDEIREDLQRFDNLIKMINFEYTQFFAGNVKRPPVVQEREVNRIMQKYNVAQITNFTLRFKFNNIVARYLTLKEKWRRKMMEFEGYKPRTDKKIPSDTTLAKEEKLVPTKSKQSVLERELEKLPASYSKDKVKSVIESKIMELKNKGYKQVSVKIDIVDGKPKLKIKPGKA